MATIRALPLFMYRWSNNATKRTPSRHIKLLPYLCNNFGYSQDDAVFILNKLNNFTPETSQILGEGNSKKLDVYKQKNGNLNELEDLLKVHGLGLKSIKRMCDKMIASRSGNITAKPSLTRRQRVPILHPSLTVEDTAALRNICGIHVSQNEISWASIDSISKSLMSWEVIDLTSIMCKKKPDLFTLISVGQDVLNKVPEDDTYVLEEFESGGPMGLIQTKILLKIVLSTLLQQSKGANSKILFINGRAVNQWSGRLIGNEKTSSQDLAGELVLKLSGRPLERQPPTETRIYADPTLRQLYASHQPAAREALADALLLTVGFMDLVLKRY